MRIAICDDEKNIRELIGNKVKRQYEEADIMFFSSGEELLLSEEKIDILFLDIQMNGENGMETARELRNRDKKVIIIFVTVMEDYVFQAFDVGAFHYSGIDILWYILLAEQIENTKQHISEVEKLYEDIRALKHDMGNHICVLENLFCKIEMDTDDSALLKREEKEFKNYLSELKKTWNESVSEIRTGNPVTDVILTQKQKEAKEKGIDFMCQFAYPMETNINVFDISVILHNAIENAFEGTKGCVNPYVSIVSYRRKNAYMLEVKNCISKKAEIDHETGLPETTKIDKDSHGYGLTNVRKVARKYYGDIDIWQDEKSFTLTVMLMVK